MDAEQVAWIQVKRDLHAARQDASRQHARELQLELRQAHTATAALKCQVRQALLFPCGDLLIEQTVDDKCGA